MLREGFSVTAAVCLAGCASINGPSVSVWVPDGASWVPDTERMGAVERQAVRFGVKVIWVNPPLRPASNPG